VSGGDWVGIGADPFQIYQVVRKLADEQAQLENGGKRLTVSSVYDSIKHSNSSLKRKKLLEESIDRVLLVLREEQDDSESLDGDFEGLEDPVPQLKVGH
jgi:ribosome biogenesis ATPase